ncbi:heme utilization protein [Bifidobacterium longum]|uniref:heme utilization protein n=1 Tax=Bifidobacterium longum TaxID=216816 RepID=UPI0015FA4EDB|nr:heme utilization protein [Bifidobacterium longum]
MPTVLAKPTQPAAPITPGAAPVAAPGATSTTMNEQQKKIFIIVGAVAGFLVLFGIVYGVLSSAVFSAKSVANSYVAAISSGNYDKANTIADPHVNTNQRALLTSKASSGENTRISQTSNNADGTVSAQLTYTLEGKEVNGNFTIKDNKVSVEFSE